MKSEIRRYKIVGFREGGPATVRVILDPAELVKKPQQRMGMNEMMQNPMGAAQQMMGQQMQQMIHDTFSITREEYMEKKYIVGDVVTVTINKEQH